MKDGYSGIISENVTKIYKSKKRQGVFRSISQEKIAVRDLSFQLPMGQITGLLGLNGAGKTTTIKMLSTLLLPTSGRITVGGLDIERDTMLIRKRINMVAGGERMIYWRLTGRENLWYFAQLYDIKTHIVKERIDELLHLVKLEDAADTVVERYSKGMKQRLQIARGLINDPGYLFLDEPTIGLDAPIARELRQTIRTLGEQGKCILLTSHYLQEVEELCAYIYVIHQGCLVAEGTPKDLKQLTHQEHIIRVLVSELTDGVAEALKLLAAEHQARLDLERTDDGVAVIIKHPMNLSGRVAAAVAEHGNTILKLEILEPSLEDAMLALTTGDTEDKPLPANTMQQA